MKTEQNWDLVFNGAGRDHASAIGEHWVNARGDTVTVTETGCKVTRKGQATNCPPADPTEGRKVVGTFLSPTGKVAKLVHSGEPEAQEYHTHDVLELRGTEHDSRGAPGDVGRPAVPA